MTQTDIVRKVDTAGAVFRGVAWLVALLGILWAASWVWFGFVAEEPWWFWGAKVEENWESILFGFVAAGTVLIYTAIVWSVLQLLSGIAGYISHKVGNGMYGG